MKFFLITLSILFLIENKTSASEVPNLIGTWKGENNTISDLKGLKSWEKKINITEQTDRRFRGNFTYTGGTKNFFGMIHPDNETITWVASNSRGYNLGKLLETNKLSSCYGESAIDATVGCAILKRSK